ncbi:MAG: DNA polymerase III subunit delta' [Clostridia bacterium]|nr:DNA polymerase III subunit delta' [Clostridia bacterium]
MSFENIIGNDKVKNILTKSLNNNTVLHSYMFIGEQGIGKKLTAIQFAKMILCEDFALSECNRCKSCVEFNGGNNPDFVYIEPDGKVIKIEQIRELQKKVIEKPVNSNKKVYIINDADLMTKEAQNCLLKTLEEPPEYIVIILVVSNENKVLTTIKSRCMKIHFDKIEDNEINKYLKEKCGIDNVSKSILKMCDGSIGKCINIQDRLDDYNEIENIFLNFNKSLTTVVNSAEILYKNKENINDYLDYINVILYQKSIENKNNNLKYINSIKIVEKTKQRLLSNSNYDMCIDYLLFNIWEEINEKNSRG